MFFEQDEKTDQATVQDSTAQSTSDKSGPDLKKNDVTAPATQASEKFTDDAKGKKDVINPKLDPAKNIKQITDYLKTAKIRWKASGTKA